MEFQNEYYQIKTELLEQNGIWKAHAIVIRRDSLATVPSLSFGAAADSKEDALLILRKKLERKILKLESPPDDWGVENSPCSIVIHYIQTKGKISEMIFTLETALFEGKLTIDMLRESIRSIQVSTEELTIESVTNILRLSQDQIIELLRSPEKVYQDIYKSSHLDDAYAREEIFRFIKNPTQIMLSTYTAHKERCMLEFERQKSV
ncbi:hypothetical protein [Pseudomonas indica]|uniref:hypothetical protein n=1 Tax=Pseudomonas indica TaxID=137658 RepID=UPI0023F61F3E|nr:hypothetical protein [Pseudomonas indica]MBU3058488.1 hypothetical protein [Pseudomonas indica]